MREKTAKIGMIGRASAIFRVNKIIVYADRPKVDQKKEMDLISTLLGYMDTPQYLRKRLFRLSPDLQFAGVLPPLRTPHHPLNSKIKNLKTGEYREAAVISKTDNGLLTDIGVEQPAFMFKRNYSIGSRLTVKIANLTNRVEVEPANRNEIPTYWGYEIGQEKGIMQQFLQKEHFDLTIATSKRGTRLSTVFNKLKADLGKANNIIVLFGAPTRGLYEIAKDEKTDLDGIADYVLNTIPSQGTETIRTEEAIVATLALFNILF